MLTPSCQCLNLYNTSVHPKHSNQVHVSSASLPHMPLGKSKSTIWRSSTDLYLDTSLQTWYRACLDASADTIPTHQRVRKYPLAGQQLA